MLKNSFSVCALLMLVACADNTAAWEKTTSSLKQVQLDAEVATPLDYAACVNAKSVAAASEVLSSSASQMMLDSIPALTVDVSACVPAAAPAVSEAPVEATPVAEPATVEAAPVAVEPVPVEAATTEAAVAAAPTTEVAPVEVASVFAGVEAALVGAPDEAWVSCAKAWLAAGDTVVSSVIAANGVSVEISSLDCVK